MEAINKQLRQDTAELRQSLSRAESELAQERVDRELERSQAALQNKELRKALREVRDIVPCIVRVSIASMRGDPPSVTGQHCAAQKRTRIDAQSAQQVAKSAAEKGLSFVDAPVSGGTAGAAAGTLTFICGGENGAFELAKPILGHMGANILHAGAAGAGQVAKICNNMLLSVLMVATSESLQMGIDHGLDPKVLSEIMKVSSGGNWTLDKYNPCPDVMPNVPSSNDYQGGFMVDLMVKDLGLSQEAALVSNSSTPMGALARSLYVNHARQGNGSRDFSSIFEQFTNSQQIKK